MIKKDTYSNQNPTITVLVPFYNGASTILDTLISVKEQTHKKFECLILDDGSDAEQAQQLEKKIKYLDDMRFRIITGSNVGLCENLNRALAKISTPFIGRIDQDDICMPHRFERQIKVLRERNSDCCFSGVIKFGEKKETIYRPISDLDVIQYDPKVLGGVVHSTMLVKTEVLKSLDGYDAKYYPSDDWDLTLRMAEKCLKLEYVDEALVKYRFHNSANTYRFYSRMCDSRRRSEAKFRFFENLENKREEKSTLAKLLNFTKIRHYLKDNSKLCFRRAGGSYLDGKMVLATYWMVISFMWHPGIYIQRLTLFYKKGS